MEKSVLERFKNNLESAGVTEFSIRLEGGNKTLANNEDSKIFLQDDYIIGIETRNNHGAPTNASYNIVAAPYDNIDDAKTFDLTIKETIDFLNAEGITIDEDLKKFLSSHNRVSMGQRKQSGYYGEIHNNKGQVAFPTSLPGRITVGTTSDKEGKVQIDPEATVE